MPSTPTPTTKPTCKPTSSSTTPAPRRSRQRLFDYGELRLLVLAMMADAPRHGYEVIKAIEERMAGSYRPSPGVIYPTLAWLEDMGYASLAAQQSGRKPYAITPEGKAFLTANQTAADELMRRGLESQFSRDDLPSPIRRAMENLKYAIRLRLREGGIDEQAANAIAEAMDAAARIVERTRVKSR